MWQIIINGPGYFDTAYELPEGVTSLGRADENDIVLSGDLVSRKHANLHSRGDGVKLEDLGSRNGSRINGRGVQGIHDLKEGDLVVVGENTLTLRAVHAAESTRGGQTALAPPSEPALPPLPSASTAGNTEVQSAVIFSRKVKESVVLRALDNVFPFVPFGSDAVLPSPVAAPASEAGAAPASATGAGSVPPYEAVLLLYKVAEALASAETLEAFLETSLGLVLRATRATTAVVLLRTPSGKLEPACVHHQGQAIPQGEVPVSHAIVVEALRQGAALLLADGRDDQRFSTRESVLMYASGQVLCIPLGAKEPFSGALYLNRPAGTTEELEGLVDLTTAVAHLMATGVAKFARTQELEPEPPFSSDGATHPAARALGAAPASRLEAVLERVHSPETLKRRLEDHRRAGQPTTLLEDKIATVLFADLAGFSALSRKLETRQLNEILEEFYTRCASILLSFDGTVATFVGDSVLALFGAPYARHDDAPRAVRAALALRLDWQKLMMKRPASERCGLKVGLHTGNVIAGTVGTERRVEYAAVGEPVNLAAWLVGMAGPDQILMTGRTRSSVGNRFEVSALGERSIHAGAKEKVALFEVLEEDLGVRTNPGVAGA